MLPNIDFLDSSSPIQALTPRIPIKAPLEAALLAEDDYWWSTNASLDESGSPRISSPCLPLPSGLSSDSDPESEYLEPGMTSPIPLVPPFSKHSPSPISEPGHLLTTHSPPPEHPPALPQKKRRRKKTPRDLESRKERRTAARQALPPTERTPGGHLIKLHEASPEVLEAALAILNGLPVTTTVYTGKRVPALKEGQVWTKADLDEAGFHEFHWDGR